MVVLVVINLFFDNLGLMWVMFVGLLEEFRFGLSEVLVVSKLVSKDVDN